ncbi:hypothetical protein Ddye_021448 [Dipteronia dyeriana]|uniref:Uncharacterized protein n=1 Tax=Dipteronia dyeriana TaxID=168575 RepID=A0AAD9U2E6_9ROSI|nr:hypothetical protein Ddye_021448 [Dipteronia dyeriana]
MHQYFSKQKKIQPTAFFVYINHHRVFMPVIFRFSSNLGTSFQSSIKNGNLKLYLFPNFFVWGLLLKKKSNERDSEGGTPQCFLIWDLEIRSSYVVTIEMLIDMAIDTFIMIYKYMKNHF